MNFNYIQSMKLAFTCKIAVINSHSTWSMRPFGVVELNI